MIDLLPTSGHSDGDVYLGLIEQLHYVALKKIAKL
jgi:hypothetical protein